MRNGWSWIRWGIVLGLMGSPVWGAEPDPEAMRRLKEKYERDFPSEVSKPAPVPKPRPKPAPVPKPKPQPQPKPKPALTVNYDHEAWKSAEKCGTAACFEAYLEDYPKGRYTRMAKARLKAELIPRAPAEATAEPVEKRPAIPPVLEQPMRATHIRADNQAVAALLNIADNYAKSRQFDKAGAALERALRIEPRNAAIWHDLAQIRLHQGQYHQAESLAQKSNNLAGGNRELQSRNLQLIASARKAISIMVEPEKARAEAVRDRVDAYIATNPGRSEADRAAQTEGACAKEGGTIGGSYALQENAIALRNYYRTRNIRAEVERTTVYGRLLYVTCVWR